MFCIAKVELWEGQTYMYWVVKHICLGTCLYLFYSQVVTMRLLGVFPLFLIVLFFLSRLCAILQKKSPAKTLAGDGCIIVMRITYLRRTMGRLA